MRTKRTALIILALLVATLAGGCVNIGTATQCTSSPYQCRVQP